MCRQPLSALIHLVHTGWWSLPYCEVSGENEILGQCIFKVSSFKPDQNSTLTHRIYFHKPPSDKISHLFVYGHSLPFLRCQQFLTIKKKRASKMEFFFKEKQFVKNQSSDANYCALSWNQQNCSFIFASYHPINGVNSLTALEENPPGDKVSVIQCSPNL